LKEEHWICPTPEKLPDFIIGGAMKSGTTTLHHILDAHPGISIPKKELGFFDMDSIYQHTNFFIYDKKPKTWHPPFIENDPGLYWEWYTSQFNKCKNKLIGEDSTTYLASKRAAKRISIQKKAIKLIFVLRHPTHRSFSNYNHLVKTGRALYSFEDTLKINPFSILNRSLYTAQLEYYYEHFPAENIKIILFEDLISNKTETIKDICSFLNIDFSEIDVSSLEKHSNKTLVPKNLKLKLLFNRRLLKYRSDKAVNNLPKRKGISKKVSSLTELCYLRLEKLINPLGEKKPKKIKPETKLFLDNFFERELYGLDELTGVDIMNRWFS